MAPTKGGIDFTHLMTSGQFSDLKLVCQGREFKIHKLVACSQSSVIATALKGEFKVSNDGAARFGEVGSEFQVGGPIWRHQHRALRCGDGETDGGIPLHRKL